MKLVAFSDVHGYCHEVNLPDGDVLIFAGDLMTSGYKKAEVLDFGEWFSSQPHRTKIVVAGNHDRLFESNPTWCRSCFGDDVIYLENTWTVIDGIKFFGSPVQPWFHNWAFNVPRGPAIKEYWDRIPDDTNVLITHGPPYGHLDKMVNKLDPYYDSYEHLGCEELMKAIQRVRPQVHIFGHIHGGYGSKFLNSVGTTLYNVAICDEAYVPNREPVVIEL